MTEDDSPGEDDIEAYCHVFSESKFYPDGSGFDQNPETVGFQEPVQVVLLNKFHKQHELLTFTRAHEFNKVTYCPASADIVIITHDLEQSPTG